MKKLRKSWMFQTKEQDYKKLKEQLRTKFYTIKNRFNKMHENTIFKSQFS